MCKGFPCMSFYRVQKDDAWVALETLRHWKFEIFGQPLNRAADKEGNPPKGEKCAVVKEADRVGNLDPIDIIHGESDFETPSVV